MRIESDYVDKNVMLNNFLVKIYTTLIKNWLIIRLFANIFHQPNFAEDNDDNFRVFFPRKFEMTIFLAIKLS